MYENKPDIIVVGSGAAGLTAAIAAHDMGAKVLILERTNKVGGTSAISGGGIWIPLNHHMEEVGFQDSRDEAINYCKAVSMNYGSDEIINTYVDTAPEMIKYIEANTPIKFHAMTAPDYYPETIGGKLGGRSIEADPFDTNLLGEWKNNLRPPNAFAFPITRQEAFGDYDAFFRPWLVPQDLVVERMANGVVALGQALVAGLLKAVLDRGIKIRLDTRVRKLVIDEEGHVLGVSAGDKEENLVYFNANLGVILASGGFEWNRSLMKKFVPGVIENPNSPPFSDGDGLLMGMEIGADLENMSEVWHYPSYMIPGETYEDKSLSRPINAERNAPNVIWVNKSGKRFVNETANYNIIGRSFQKIRTDRMEMENLPAWAILDSKYRQQYPLGTSMPEDPDPQWVLKGDSLKELAIEAGIDPDALVDSVAKWNGYVSLGKDLDFGRGESAYDKFQGDKDAINPNMGSIDTPPFYALPIHTGALGTKGGLNVNSNGQVLDTHRNPILGLYAAGNVAASFTGAGYFGRGSTLGPAMTWGYIAGKHLARSINAS